MRRNRTKSFCEIAAERGLLERLVNLDSLEQIFLELRQLARAKCRLGPSPATAARFRYSVLLRVQIDHECSQRAFHARQFALKRYETCARNTRSGFEIHQPHRLADGDVILRIVDPARGVPIFARSTLPCSSAPSGTSPAGKFGNAARMSCNCFERSASFALSLSIASFKPATTPIRRCASSSFFCALAAPSALDDAIARAASASCLGGLRRAQLRIERQDRTGLRRHPAPRHAASYAAALSRMA